MSRHGVWQLKQLTLYYCKFSGSSTGARAVVDSLPRDAPAAPQLAVQTGLVPGGHPYLKALYRSGNERKVGLRNLGPREIWGHVRALRDAAGRRTSVRVPSQRQVLPWVRGGDGAYVRASPSVQGPWQPQTR